MHINEKPNSLYHKWSLSPNLSKANTHHYKNDRFGPRRKSTPKAPYSTPYDRGDKDFFVVSSTLECRSPKFGPRK